MKQKYKLLAIIIAALLLISALPLAAFADEYEETDAYGNAVTEYQENETIAESDTNETSAIQDGEIESDTETDIAITDEIESFVFEYSEKDELPTLSRMIGDGGVDLGPPEDDSTTTVVTSSIIPDGIYAIESVFAPGLWVDVNDVTVGGTLIWQDCHNIYPTNSFERSALFKIRYIEETNSYVIRLMTNNMLTLTFEDTNRLITKTISSPYDESVPVEETFVITRVSGAYIIKQYGDDTRALASRSPNGGEVNSPDSILVRESTGIAQDKAKWKLYKYTGTDRHGMTVYSSASYRNDGIPVGSTGVLRNITWSTVTGSNIPHMQAASNSAEMISTSYNYNLGEMSFTALSPGYATIQSMILKESTGISQYTERVYFQIIPEEGTYLIRNSGSKSYIDIKGPNKDEGTLLHQWTYSEKLWRRWIIEHVPNGEGYVRIKSAYSDKYIGVDSTTNTIIKQTSTLDDYTLWKLERTATGNLKLVCKALSSTVALAVPQGTDIDDNGTNLTTVAYTNNNYYNDEWLLIKNRLNIEITFDQGYIERHKQTGESNNVVIERITNNFENQYYTKISLAFERLFGIEFYLKPISNYMSDADLCPKNGLDDQCSCYSEDNCLLKSNHSPIENNYADGFEHSCHCTNFSRLRNNLIVDLPPKTIRVTYSGHKLCKYDNIHYYEPNTVALSNSNYPIICCTISQQDNNKFGILVLFHEILHTFEVQHHNYNGENCVMATNDPNRYNNINFDVASDYLCDDCASIVIENIDKY